MAALLQVKREKENIISYHIIVGQMHCISVLFLYQLSQVENAVAKSD